MDKVAKSLRDWLIYRPEQAFGEAPDRSVRPLYAMGV
jgi:hypothetical protein